MKKLIIVLILAALFFGCKTEASTTKTYTVTIDPNGGTLEQKTYTVEEGKTFTLSPEPTPAAQYYKVKEYINTTTNSPFTMGSTAVNGDITLKVEWTVDLYVVRDMLTKDGGKWSVTGTEATDLAFRKINDPSLDVQYDLKNSFVTTTNRETVLVESDRADMIAKIVLTPSVYDYIRTISATSMTIFNSSFADGGSSLSDTIFTKVNP